MSETFRIHPDDPLPEFIDARLRDSVRDPGLLEGLLSSLGQLLSQIAADPLSPSTIKVTLNTGPDLVEVRFQRGHVSESLLCTLPGL